MIRMWRRTPESQARGVQGRGRRTTVVFTLGLLPVLVGSAGQAAQSKVTFWFYGSARDIQVIEQLMADFERENPDIDVELVTVTYTSGWDKWVTAVAGGAPPDVSMANWGIFNVLGTALEPLDDLTRSSRTLQARNFFAAMWDTQVYDGKRLGLPFRANSQVILYNKRMFAEAGLSGVPQSWQEFADFATRLTRREGNAVSVWGYSFRNYPLNRTVNHWAQRNGWVPFDEFYTSPAYTDPKLVDTVGFLLDLVNRGVAAIPGMPNVGNLAGEKVAMLTEGPWVLSGIQTANPSLELGAFVPPRGPSGVVPYANLGGENLVMFKGAKDKKAALRWMEYLAYTRNADYNKLTGAFLPVVRHIVNDPYWVRSDVWRAVLQNYDEGRMPPNPAGVPCGVRLVSGEAYDRALEDIFRKREVAPRTALEGVQQVALNDVRLPELRACVDRKR